MSFKSTGLVFAEKPSIGIEPTNLPDRSRFGNDGTYTNITDVQLPSGLWVRDFDGSSSRIDIASGACKNFADQKPWTTAVWLYAETNSYEYIWGSTTHPPSIVLVDATRVTFQDDALHLITIGAYVDCWMYLVMTMNASRGSTVYRDGVVKGTSTVNDSAMDFRILGTRFTAGLFFNGCIALPRIYYYVLSAGKIKQMFEAERHWFGV